MALFGHPNNQKLNHDPAPIINLLVTIAQHSPLMFEEMYKSSSFRMMGFLMEKIPPQYFSEETISKLEHLANLVVRSFGIHFLF